MKRNFIAFSTIAAFLLSSGNAAAYIGPGASISAIGTVIALIGAVLLGILGFVWYPIKRLLAKRNQFKSKDSGGQELRHS